MNREDLLKQATRIRDDMINKEFENKTKDDIISELWNERNSLKCDLYFSENENEDLRRVVKWESIFLKHEHERVILLMRQDLDEDFEGVIEDAYADGWNECNDYWKNGRQ